MKLRLVPQLSQKLIMTPQLQQAIKLLQLSRLELQQSLTQHLLENPLLDEIQSDVDEGESCRLGMGRCGREKVEGRYTWSKLARQLEAVYEQVLEK